MAMVMEIVTQVISFVVCGPRDFDETSGAVALTRWIENMKSMIDNSGCLGNQKVKYAASSFIGKALTWWNIQVQARGRDAANAMVWDDFKPLLTTKLCPSNEIEKLEGASTPQSYSLKTLRNAEYSNCKHLLDKITILEATVDMYMHPKQHTVNSAALFHEVYDNMGKLDLE
nr:reverse transcriptase domain-containing protein [Tanacetum cinerariifolium]